jgi:hypothetical protein
VTTQAPGQLTIQPVAIQGVPTQALYSRSSTVSVGTKEITNIGQQIGLDVWFQVKRSLKAGEPNTADLKIWNLSETSLKQLSQAAQTITVATAPGGNVKVIPVKIVAGYETGTATIFLGELRAASTIRDGEDFVTELQSGDGDLAQILTRSNFMMPKGSNALQVVTQCLDDMETGHGNLSSQSIQSILKSEQLYSLGAMLKGSSWQIIRDTCKSVGLECSIANGQAQFLSTGQPLAGDAYELTPTQGLIGEPTVDTKGIMSCTTLLIPHIKPGSTIVVNSRFVNGTYRVISMTTTGQTWGDDSEWQHEIEGKSIGTASGI